MGDKVFGLGFKTEVDGDPASFVLFSSLGPCLPREESDSMISRNENGDEGAALRLLKLTVSN